MAINMDSVNRNRQAIISPQSISRTEFINGIPGIRSIISPIIILSTLAPIPILVNKIAASPVIIEQTKVYIN